MKRLTFQLWITIFHIVSFFIRSLFRFLSDFPTNGWRQCRLQSISRIACMLHIVERKLCCWKKSSSIRNEWQSGREQHRERSTSTHTHMHTFDYSRKELRIMRRIRYMEEGRFVDQTQGQMPNSSLFHFGLSRWLPSAHITTHRTHTHTCVCLRLCMYTSGTQLPTAIANVDEAHTILRVPMMCKHLVLHFVLFVLLIYSVV